MKTLRDVFWTNHRRLGRGGYWLFTLAIFFFAAAFVIFGQNYIYIILYADELTRDSGDFAFPRDGGPPIHFWFLIVVFGLAQILLLIVGIRRRRDRDRSGLDVVGFTLLPWIFNRLGLDQVALVGPAIDVGFTGYGIFLIVVLGFLKGTPGPNRYRPDPRESP